MNDIILQVNELKKTFGKAGNDKAAVNGVSFYIAKGECLGLVGESGCGKSTVANLIAGFIRPDEGSILFQGKQLGFRGKSAQTDRSSMQMIFQNPNMSLNPRMTVYQNLEEAVIYYEKLSKEELQCRMETELSRMGIPTDYLKKYPRQMSGGECQRVAIARTLMRQPKLLICDEITSALDVSVQAEIMKYLLMLKRSGISFLFITHDLLLADNFCDRIAVMKDGRMIQ